MVGKNQSGFIKGRNILDGIVVLHEVIHELHFSHKKGLIRLFKKRKVLFLKLILKKLIIKLVGVFLSKSWKRKTFPKSGFNG